MFYSGIVLFLFLKWGVCMMLKKITSKYHDINIEKMNLLMGKWVREGYDKGLVNVNNVSNWFPKVKDVGFKVPDTVVVPLSFDRFKWLSYNNCTEGEIEIFTKELKEYLNDVGFDINRLLFLKTGVYSAKYNFNWCRLEDINKIGANFVNIFSDGVNKGFISSELVVREYIKSKNERPKIYNGMPLNTEFRVYYDFDKKEILGVFNYWDKDTMNVSLNIVGKHLPSDIIESKKEEYATFKSMINILDIEFDELKNSLIGFVNNNMSKVVGLEGIWSIDFMCVDGAMYLIDMSLDSIK